ncbi:unnamed protein product [Alternaria alternata]
MPPKAVQTPAPSTDIGDTNSGPPVTKAKRKVTSNSGNMARKKRPKIVLHSIEPSSSDPIDHGVVGPSGHLDLSNLGITIDETTKNTSNFLDMVNNKGLKLKGTARKSPYVLPSYEPSDADGARYVRDLPHYAPGTRRYMFDEESVVLVDHVQPNGVTAKCWVMQAKNALATNPNENIDLYQLHIRAVEGFGKDRHPKDISPLPCKQCKKVPELKKTCDKNTPCNHCHDAGRDEQCLADMAVRVKTLRARSAMAVKKTALDTKTRWNILTDIVCNDRDQIIELGQITVDVMNKTPEELRIEDWYTNQGTPLIRSFITVTSLLAWKKQSYPQLDLGTFHPQPSLWSKYGFAGCSPWVIEPLTEKGRRIWWPSSTHPWLRHPPYIIATNGEAARFSLSGLDLDTAVVDATPYSSGWHLFGAEPVQSAEDKLCTLRNINLENEVDWNTVKAMQIILHSMVGMVGSSRMLLAKFNSKLKPLLKSSNSVSDTVPNRAPYDGHQILSLNIDPSGLIAFQVIFPASADLDRSGLEKDIARIHGVHLSDEAREYRLSRRLRIPTTVRDVVCHAWVFEQCLRALARGELLLQTLLIANVVIDQMELGLITRSQIVANYCTCGSRSVREQTEHVCVHCKGNWLCANMTTQPDRDGRLITCIGCASRNLLEIPAKDSFIAHPIDLTLREQIRFNVLRIHRRERKIEGFVPTWTRDEMTTRLFEEHKTDDQYTWTRGYAPNQIISLRTRSGLGPATNDLTRVGFDPYAMSIEKPHQRFIAHGSDKVSLHHLDNVVLELHCINLLKARLSVSSVPLHREALLLREQVDGRPPCEGYYKDVEDKWEIIERAHDHQRLISSFSSYHNTTRVDQDQDLTAVRHAIEMEKTGVWDGTLPYSRSLRGQYLRHLTFSTRGELGKFLKNDDGSPKFTMDDEYWDWKIIMQNIDQLEQDPGFNPHKIKFPRLGRKKLPWFWRKDSCPQDLDEKFLFREFNARLVTMDEMCDPHHETEESPASLLLEYAVQFLETGGKDHLFGFIMTAYMGHMANYSFSRGIVQKVQDGEDRIILPGDHLKTGCTVLLPKDMKTDYDITRRTVLVESWLTNRFRYLFRGGPALMGVLEDAVRTIEPTKWYNEMKTDLNDYLKVPLPKSYKDKASWVAQMIALDPNQIAEELGDEEAQDDEAAAVLDDEELFFAEQLEETEALRAVTPGDPATVTCSECNESGDETTLLACSMAHHATKMTHYHCLGLDAMPEDSDTWPCKQCESGSKPSFLVKLKYSRYLNMMNIGNTCYLSSAVQGLHAIDPVRNFILDASKERMKGHDVSGRATHSWLTGTPTSQTLSTAMSAHMNRAIVFMRELRKLFLRLDQKWRPIEVSDVSPLLDALCALDPRSWVRHQQNDSAELLTFTLLRIILVTDDSDFKQRQLDDVAEKKAISDRGLLCRLDNEHFDDRVKTHCCSAHYCRKCLQLSLADHGQKCPECGTASCTVQPVNSLSDEDIARAGLPPLAEASLSDYAAHVRRGWDSWMFEAFCIQTVTESKCSDCRLISRKFTCDLQMLDLEFTNPQSNENSLTRMMKQWLRKELDDNIHCVSGCRAHAGSKVQHKRITRTSEYIYIRFNRAGPFNKRVLCGVDVAAYLDISRYADFAKIPSDPKRVVKMGGSTIYQLVTVNVFHPSANGGHYVTYSLRNGIWQKFDDLEQSHTIQQHPQAAINSGGVIHYVIYQRIAKRTSLPLNQDYKLTTGHVLHKGVPVPPAVERPPQWDRVVCDHKGCGLTFTKLGHSVLHAQVAHRPNRNQPTVVCERCTASMPGREPLFHYQFELAAHVEAMHPTTDQDHVCALCGNAFADKVLLDTHKMACTLTCDACGETFVNKALFDTHKSTCTLTCKGCGKTFTSKTLLQDHMCMTSCNGCGDTFEFVTALQTHQDACVQYLRKALAAERGRVDERDKLLTEVLNSKLAMKKSKERQLVKNRIQAEALKKEAATLKVEIEDLDLQISNTKARLSGSHL